MHVQDVATGFGLHTTTSICGRDRLVVRTLRCGRSNPGSNPGHGIFAIYFFPFKGHLSHPFEVPLIVYTLGKK